MRLIAAVVLLTLGWAGSGRSGKRPRLKAFASCTQLVDYARAGAERTRGGVGVTGRAAPMPIDAVITPPMPVQRTGGDVPVPTMAPEALDGGTAIGGTVPDFSGTNVQELGVDEPDILKTDGRRVFAVTDQTLRVIDVGERDVNGRSSSKADGHVLLLRGIEYWRSPEGRRGPGGAAAGAGFRTDRRPRRSSRRSTSAPRPRCLRTMAVPGTFVDARQNGGRPARDRRRSRN